MDEKIEVVSTEETNKLIEAEANEAKLEEAKPQETPPDGEKEGDKAEDKAEEKPKHKKSRAQKRIERQQRDNKALREEIERLKALQQEDKVIDPDDFDSYEEYLDAMAEEKPEPKQDISMDNRVADMFEDGNEEYEDFNEKVKAPDLALTEELFSNVLESENPAEVVYYLANNKDLTQKIAKLSEKQQIKEIAKIELSLGEKEKKVEVSKAPKPIEPLDGGRQPVKSLDDDDLPYEEYEKLLNSKRKANVGGFL